MGTSVIQEYYKLQELWKKVDTGKDCKMALWVVDFHDVEIVSGFMGIEASPLGKFKDIFFHFTTEYKGDDYKFEEALFKEYISWFDKPHKQEEDMMLALKNDGLLLQNYSPDETLKPTAENLWKEMLRFKSCIKDIQDRNFFAYFQIPSTDAAESTAWYKDVLSRGIPDGIRLVAIDYKDKRKIKLNELSKVILLEPKLNMAEALDNEISKGSFNSNTVGPEGRYRKLVLSILKRSQQGKSSTLDKEIEQLFSVAKEMGETSTIIGSYLIASQAYFYVRDNEKCELYADRTIKESEKLMNDPNTNLYPVWRGAVMLKAAMYIGNKKGHKAIELYQKIAEEATKRADAFFIMDAYRLIAHLYYDLGNLEDAFETSLLSLAGGSYLAKDVIRQSTFLHSANLTLLLAEKIRSYDDVKTIENQLSEWIGEDWELLVRNEIVNKVKTRGKTSFIERINVEEL
ncbi:hypothetical protein AGMMS50239_38770 [Bacteroidia bacterium]|nr:hypothetical protein AGMMS50239_38770 [Bacteroidia bacterium]